jgi:hypothetical protein
MNLLFLVQAGLIPNLDGRKISNLASKPDRLPLLQSRLFRPYEVPFEVLAISEIKCPEDTIQIVWVESITLRELGPSFKSGHHIARGCENARGQKHGSWTAWYERGEIVQQGTFNNRRQEGKVMTYYETGAKAGEWQYENGRRIGDAILWDLNGGEVKR